MTQTARIGDVKSQMQCASALCSTHEDDTFIHYDTPESKGEDQVSYPAGVSQVLAEIENESFWFQYRNSIIIDMVQKHAQNRRFCDIGGGNGTVSEALMNSGQEVLLVEPGKVACHQARHIRKIPVVYQAVLEDGPMPKNSQTLLGAFDVIEHIEDPVSFLKGIGKLASSDAILLISVPALQWLWSHEDIHAGHYRRYTKKSLKKHMEQAGWNVQRTFFFFSFLPLPIFLRRSIPWLLNSKSKQAYASVESASQDHIPPNRLVSLAIRAYLNIEKQRIRWRLGPLMGSSLFAIAQKP